MTTIRRRALVVAILAVGVMTTTQFSSLVKPVPDGVADAGINVEIITGDVAICPGEVVTFKFVTRMLGGFEGLGFRNVFVESSICSSVALVGGDVNGNGHLDFGEEFTNECSVAVLETQTHFAFDGADVYFNDQMFGTVNGTDTSEVTILNCGGGCSLTLGYWKTHPEDWPITEVTVGGVTYDQEEALSILNTSVEHDSTIILFHQVVPAILNIANGADPADAADVLLAADLWLMDNPVGSDPRGSSRRVGIALARELDDYNNGRIGPGHCGD